MFDPDQPLYYDFGPRVGASYSPKPGLVFETELDTSLFSEFEKIHRGTKGRLPHVRTDLKNYLNVTDFRINNMTGSSFFKLSDDLFGRITAGYFEPMYAGISGEIYKEELLTGLSLGAEINYAIPRGYRQLFSTREILGMPPINGHMSAYIDTNYYFYKMQIDAGRYLAGDNGFTFTTKRSFPNGYNIGAFFTITDASAEDFGEGSFDKGFFLRIPFEPLMPYQTQSGVFELVRPLQGDGGQRINIYGRLNEVLNRSSKSQLDKTWGRIWR